MRLILPTKKYKESYYDLIDSAKKNGDMFELGNSLIRSNENFEDMLLRLKNRKIGKNIAKRDVPSTVYWILEKNEIIGTIDLRHMLNKDYFERLGHVAYYIKPEMRNKGFATKALSLAKRKYYKKYVNKILITCYDENEASKKVILKNNGILETKIKDKNSNKYILKYFITIREDGIVAPKTIWLTTNRSCNNKCNWCYASKCKDKKMSFEEIKEYVNELSKIGVTKIILIGGEPTIYDDIIKTIKYIANKGIIVSMASNGRKFSNFEFAKSIAQAGLKNCNISIKGSNEKEYINNTNSSGFYEMVEGYKNLLKTGVNVSTSFVLCDKDYKNFDIFLKSFIESGLDNISFQLYKPSVDGETYTDAPTIYDLARLTEYAFNKIKNTNIRYSFEISIPLCTLDKDILNEMIEKKCITTCCHITKGTGLIFDADFNILPCNHFVNHPLNKRKVDIRKIIDFWNYDEPNEFRKIVKTYPHEFCSKCELWTKCGGGCFLRWLSSDPNLYINSKYEKEVK